MIKSVVNGCDALDAKDLIEFGVALIYAQNIVTEKIKEKTREIEE